jgi:hypothetical protein
MKYLDIVHPAAKTLADISLSQARLLILYIQMLVCGSTGKCRGPNTQTIPTPTPIINSPPSRSNHKKQDAEVGDGTTSVVLLAAEILKQVKVFVEDGLHPQVNLDVDIYMCIMYMYIHVLIFGPNKPPPPIHTTPPP